MVLRGPIFLLLVALVALVAGTGQFSLGRKSCSSVNGERGYCASQGACLAALRVSIPDSESLGCSAEPEGHNFCCVPLVPSTSHDVTYNVAYSSDPVGDTEVEAVLTVKNGNPATLTWNGQESVECTEKQDPSEVHAKFSDGTMRVLRRVSPRALVLMSETGGDSMLVAKLVLWKKMTVWKNGDDLTPTSVPVIESCREFLELYSFSLQEVLSGSVDGTLVEERGAFSSALRSMMKQMKAFLSDATWTDEEEKKIVESAIPALEWNFNSISFWGQVARDSYEAGAAHHGDPVEVTRELLRGTLFESSTELSPSEASEEPPLEATGEVSKALIKQVRRMVGKQLDKVVESLQMELGALRSEAPGPNLHHPTRMQEEWALKDMIAMFRARGPGSVYQSLCDEVLNYILGNGVTADVIRTLDDFVAEVIAYAKDMWSGLMKRPEKVDGAMRERGGLLPGEGEHVASLNAAARRRSLSAAGSPTLLDKGEDRWKIRHKIKPQVGVGATILTYIGFQDNLHLEKGDFKAELSTNLRIENPLSSDPVAKAEAKFTASHGDFTFSTGMKTVVGGLYKNPKMNELVVDAFVGYSHGGLSMGVFASVAVPVAEGSQRVVTVSGFLDYKIGDHTSISFKNTNRFEERTHRASMNSVLSLAHRRGDWTTALSASRVWDNNEHVAGPPEESYRVMGTLSRSLGTTGSSLELNAFHDFGDRSNNWGVSVGIRIPF